jgi:hypothetical protein
VHVIVNVDRVPVEIQVRTDYQHVFDQEFRSFYRGARWFTF